MATFVENGLEGGEAGGGAPVKETLHQIERRHKLEVKDLKRQMEKERNKMTRGLKGKDKKRALTTFKEILRTGEAALAARHKQELESGKSTPKTEGGGDDSKPAMFEGFEIKPTISMTEVVAASQDLHLEAEKAEEVEPSAGTEGDENDGWEVKKKKETKKQKYMREKRAKRKNGAGSANDSALSFPLMASTFHDAEKGVLRLRVVKVCALLRKFRTKRVFIIGGKEEGYLVEGIRDLCPLVDKLCVIGLAESEVQKSVSRVQGGVFGSSANMLRPRKYALEVKTYAGDLITSNHYVPAVVTEHGQDTVVLPEWIQSHTKEELDAMVKWLFGVLQPKQIVVSTVNKTFNSVYNMHEEQVRFAGHLWEWSHSQFHSWCKEVSESWGYNVEIGGVGDPPFQHSGVGQASSWACFLLNEKAASSKKNFWRFAAALKKLVHEWPIIKFAQAHDTGGRDTQKKVDKLYEDLEFNFQERWERVVNKKKDGEIFPDEIAPFLEEVLADDLNIDTEDGSCDFLAVHMVDIFNTTVAGDWRKADVVMNTQAKATKATVIDARDLEEVPEGAAETEDADAKVAAQDSQSDGNISAEKSETELLPSGDEGRFVPSWSGTLHDMLSSSAHDGTAARAADKSGSSAKSKHKKHMKLSANANAKKTRTKSSYLQANN
eukprot:g4395.t1